jgi:hypothetical protein
MEDIHTWLTSIGIPKETIEQTASILQKNGYTNKKDLENDPPKSSDQLVLLGIGLRWAHKIMDNLQNIKTWLSSIGITDEELLALISQALIKQKYINKKDIEEDPPSPVQLENWGIPGKWVNRILNNLPHNKPEQESKKIFSSEEISKHCVESAKTLGIYNDEFQMNRFQEDTDIKEIVDRDEAMTFVIKKMFMRWRNFRYKDKFTEEDLRSVNRVLAMSCLPGGGKTFFLDTISLMKRDFILQILSTEDKEDISEFIQYFESIFFLKVSFNGWSGGLELGLSLQEYESEVCVRILYSLFCYEIRHNNFFSFRTSLKSIGTLKLKDTINCLDHHFQEVIGISPTYMILVDELETTPYPQELCSSICSLMDERRIEFDCIFTSLDYVWLSNIRTGSRRFIQWIKLKSPSYPSLTQFFPDTLAVKILLSEVSFHWRAIVSLLKTCNQATKISASLEDYDYLSNLLQKTLELVSIPSPNKAHIVSSFSRNQIDLEAIIADKRVADWIKRGIFINSVDSDRIVPEVSTFFLKCWATNNLQDPLGYLLSQIFRLDSIVSWGSASYETYHSYWHAIRSYCFLTKDQECLPIRSFYGYKGIISNTWKERSIVVNKAMSVRSVTIADIKNSGTRFDIVYLLGKNNPGFDSITFFIDSCGSHIALATENRFSEPGASTTLSPTDVKRKYNLMKKSIRTSFHIPIRRVYFILCYWRKVPQYLDDLASGKKSDKLPKNTLLLRKKDLEFLYGPLSRRPYLGFVPEPESAEEMEISDEESVSDEENVSDEEVI